MPLESLVVVGEFADNRLGQKTDELLQEHINTGVPIDVWKQELGQFGSDVILPLKPEDIRGVPISQISEKYGGRVYVTDGQFVYRNALQYAAVQRQK